MPPLADMRNAIIFLCITAPLLALMLAHYIGLARLLHMIGAMAYGHSRAWIAAKQAYAEAYEHAMAAAPEHAQKCRVERRLAK